eukprot:gb/GEZN01002539.1/.p1 GENE.gb/GEZN01002539.1/~~gb/GEZN01002539.1/.p1  ORF type:complete len:786 (-),score=116.73 gb/GEZN01002539.1/:90-2288(-)
MNPLTGQAVQGPNFGGQGAQIIDALDTLILMGLDSQVAAARQWISRIEWKRVATGQSVFELNIRLVGGLLSAFALTQDRLYLNKAKELVDSLLPAFRTATRIPYSHIVLDTGHAYNTGGVGGESFVQLAEVGSLSLEFEYLSYALKDPRYGALARDVVAAISKQQRKAAWLTPGLFPSQIQHAQGQFSGKVSWGGGADSFYEYLFKTWQLTGQTDDQLLQMHLDSVRALKKHLVSSVAVSFPRSGRMQRLNLAFTVQLTKAHGRSSYEHLLEQDHLACFVPGLLALSAHVANQSVSSNAQLVAAAAKRRSDRRRAQLEQQRQQLEFTPSRLNKSKQHRQPSGNTKWRRKEAKVEQEAMQEDGGGEPGQARGWWGDWLALGSTQEQTTHSPPTGAAQQETAEKTGGASRRKAGGRHNTPDAMQELRDIQWSNSLLAAELVDGCVWSYWLTPKGLAPDIISINNKPRPWSVSSSAHSVSNPLSFASQHQLYKNLIHSKVSKWPLRPETVESLYILYRTSGDQRYREDGWQIFQNIEKWSRTRFGYSGLKSVTALEQLPTQGWDGHMPTYFLAETLKYLYLLFLDDDPWPFTQYVFNTEAHPFPVFSWAEGRSLLRSCGFSVSDLSPGAVLAEFNWSKPCTQQLVQRDYKASSRGSERSPKLRDRTNRSNERQVRAQENQVWQNQHWKLLLAGLTWLSILGVGLTCLMQLPYLHSARSTALGVRMRTYKSDHSQL